MSQKFSGGAGETGNDAPSVWEAASLEQNRRALLAFVYAITGDRSEAEDVVQNALAVAWKRKEDLKKGYELGPWLRGIARNLIKQGWRDSERLRFPGEAVEALENAAAAMEFSASSPSSDPRLPLVRRCLERLRAEARRIFELRYVDELSSKEIAEKLRITVTKIDTTVFRARQAVLKCVEDSKAAYETGR